MRLLVSCRGEVGHMDESNDSNDVIDSGSKDADSGSDYSGYPVESVDELTAIWNDMIDVACEDGEGDKALYPESDHMDEDDEGDKALYLESDHMGFPDRGSEDSGDLVKSVGELAAISNDMNEDKSSISGFGSEHC